MHSGFKSIVISPPPQSLGSVVKLKLFFEVKVLMLKKKKKLLHQIQWLWITTKEIYCVIPTSSHCVFKIWGVKEEGNGNKQMDLW